MNSIKKLLGHVVYGVLASAMVVSVIAPSFVSAAQITQRSMALSSSSNGATNVSYELTFTPDSTTSDAGLVVEFCANTPLIGQTCDAPTGFSAATANSAVVDSAVVGTSNKITATVDLVATTPYTITFTGVNNPGSIGQIYARVVTYDSRANADVHTTSMAPGTGVVDQGSIAIAITDTIAVSGTVLETLSFCVSGQVIADACVTTEAPVLTLGKDLGNGIIALSTDEVSTGNVYTQLSTNATSGAIVHLKSNATGCGGLLRLGDTTNACDIAPALQTNITEGQAKFGVKTTAAVPTNGQAGSGTLVPTAYYANSVDDFTLNYALDQLTGVTSTYGDPLLTTNSLPATHQNVMLTFGASSSEQTPAGTYSADLSLIAVGKF